MFRHQADMRETMLEPGRDPRKQPLSVLVVVAHNDARQERSGMAIVHANFGRGDIESLVHAGEDGFQLAALLL